MPTLPIAEIATPEEPEALPAKTEAKPAISETHHSEAHAVAKHHPRSVLHARRARNRVDPAKKYGRAPRWAQQMFENPWQSKAFSYIR